MPGLTYAYVRHIPLKWFQHYNFRMEDISSLQTSIYQCALPMQLEWKHALKTIKHYLLAWKYMLGICHLYDTLRIPDTYWHKGWACIRSRCQWQQLSPWVFGEIMVNESAAHETESYALYVTYVGHVEIECCIRNSYVDGMLHMLAKFRWYAGYASAQATAVCAQNTRSWP